MRAQKKQQIKQKIFQNWASQAAQGNTSIHWKTNNTKQKGNDSNSQQNASQINSSIKSMINKLIAQNSELRKQLYKLQHEKSIMRVSMESKQLQYKNVIRQYKEMLNSMIENLGFQGIDSIVQQSNDGDKWENRRSKLYEKFEDQVSLEYKCNLETNKKNKFNRSQSFSVGDSQSLIESMCGVNKFNPEERLPTQEIVYFQYQQQKTERTPFALNPCDYLNFDERKVTEGHNQEREGQLRLNTMSSVTDAYKPNLPVYQDYIESQIIPTVKLDLFKITACTSKAETQRLEKNTQRKQKKSSGRVSSEAGISSSSFKALIEKGLKNRERINQILQNNAKFKQIYQ